MLKPFIDKSVEQGGMTSREAVFLDKQYNRLLDDLEGVA